MEGVAGRPRSLYFWIIKVKFWLKPITGTPPITRFSYSALFYLTQYLTISFKKVDHFFQKKIDHFLFFVFKLGTFFLFPIIFGIEHRNKSIMGT